MLKLLVYLLHHTSFFVVCSTNSAALGRKTVARKKKNDTLDMNVIFQLLCDGFLQSDKTMIFDQENVNRAKLSL